MDTNIIHHSALENKLEEKKGGMQNTPKALKINWFSNSPWAS